MVDGTVDGSEVAARSEPALFFSVGGQIMCRGGYGNGFHAVLPTTARAVSSYVAGAPMYKAERNLVGALAAAERMLEGARKSALDYEDGEAELVDWLRMLVVDGHLGAGVVNSFLERRGLQPLTRTVRVRAKVTAHRMVDLECELPLGADEDSSEAVSALVEHVRDGEYVWDVGLVEDLVVEEVEQGW